MQVGQDFSIKQRDFAGNVTDQFFSVGTILQVTPQIIEQQDTTFIHLTIEAERSSAQPDPVSTVINKQEATTQSVLVNGESTVIAGLYRTESAEVRRGIPILKDLPPWLFGLRYLFGYNSEDYQMRELVILIQATIEPGIPERYAQAEYKDKYEVLEDERRRIRDEMRRSSLKTEELVEEEPEEPMDETEGSEDEESDQPEETYQEEEEPTAQNTTEPEPQQAEEETDERRSRITTDPEVKTEPVALNFGKEEEKEEEPKEQQQEPETSSEEMEANDSANSETSEDKDSESGDSASAGAAATSEESDEGSSTQAQQASSGYTYYIVAASFKNEQNAVDYKDKLAGENYPAVMLNKPDSDFFFVAYNQFGSLDQAKAALADIVEQENENAWIYRGN